MKNIFAVLVSIVMLASVLPSHVIAEEETVQENETAVIAEETAEESTVTENEIMEEETVTAEDSGIPGVIVEGCDHGTVTGKYLLRPGQVWYYEIYAHPDEGYYTESMTGTDEDGNNLVLYASENYIEVRDSYQMITVHVVFRHEPWSIEMKPAEHSSVSVTVNGEPKEVQDNVLSAREGDQVVVSGTAEEGYEIRELHAKDETGQEIGSMTGENEYSFTMIPGNVTVETVLGLKPYRILDGEMSHVQLTFCRDSEQVTAAEKDALIEIIPETETGFRVSGVEVKDAKGNLIICEQDSMDFRMPASDVTVTAFTEADQGYVMYVDENGDTYVISQYRNIEDARSGEFSDGWYVADHDFEMDDRLIARGNVNLVLCDGVTMSIRNGITVNAGASITIWGQREGSGTLNAGSDGALDVWSRAGIGGDNTQDSGSIIIHGGIINDWGSRFSAGIGGCAASVTIYDGTINATGGRYAAGIGGGDEGSANVSIYGGTVTANAGVDAAGIGGGEGADGGTIAIYGGKVSAYGNDNGAGIGGGEDGNGGTITIYGGEIIARGEGGTLIDQYAGAGAGIGGGDEGNGGNITILGGVIQAVGGKGYGGGAGIGGGDGGNGGTIVIKGGTVRATSIRGGAGIGGGNEGNGGCITIYDGDICSISDHDGVGYSGAGIGGGDEGDGGYIYIYGGNIFVLSFKVGLFSTVYGAGIGGGDEGDGQYIYIGGGRVEAHGNQAFGGGDEGESGVLDLAEGIFPSANGYILPYADRYYYARCSDIVLEKLY